MSTIIELNWINTESELSRIMTLNTSKHVTGWCKCCLRIEMLRSEHLFVYTVSGENKILGQATNASHSADLYMHFCMWKYVAMPVLAFV